MIYLIMFIFVIFISIVWTYLIDKHVKFKKENPDYDDTDGWLDWDQKNNK